LAKFKQFRDNLDDDRRETRKSLDSMKESFDSLSARVLAVEKEQFGLEDRRRDLDKRVEGLRQENLSLKKKLGTIQAEMVEIKNLFRSQSDQQKKGD
jgi:chromosome segregation ATPase